MLIAARAARALAITVAVAACSGDSEPPAKHEAPPPPPVDAAVLDTAVGEPSDGIDELPPTPTPGSKPAAPKRAARPIEIMLRSSPPGATAYVDGLQVGTTPTYWIGETGAEHEFTFMLRKHATARYRFFPVASGTLHGHLDPVAKDVPQVAPPPPPAPVTPAPTPKAKPLPPPPSPVVPIAPTVQEDNTPAPLAVDAGVVAPPAVDAAP